MLKTKAPILLAIALIGSLGVLVACSQGDQATVSEVEAAPTASTTATRDESVLLSPVGGTMIVDSPCYIPDPAIDAASEIVAVGSYPLVNEIFSGITRIVAGETGMPTVNLELAKTYEVNRANTRFTFTLRDGLRFSDGSPIQAYHVKYSWSRALRMSTGLSVARSIFGSIVGADAVIDGTSIELSGISVVDEVTFVVETKEPAPLFLELIANPAASIVSEENVESWPVRWANSDLWQASPTPMHPSGESVPLDPFTESNMPVGSGPFRLTEFSHSEPNAGCTLTANPFYFQGPPSISQVIFRPFDFSTSASSESVDSSTEAVVDFIAEEIDVVLVTESNRALLNDIDGGLATVTLRPFTLAIALNSAAPEMQDIDMRRSIVTSIGPGEQVHPSVAREWGIVPRRADADGQDEDAWYQDAVEKIQTPPQSNSALEVHSSPSVPVGVLQRALELVAANLGREVMLRIPSPQDSAQSSLGPDQVAMRVFFNFADFPAELDTTSKFARLFGDVNQGLYGQIRREVDTAASDPDPTVRERKFREVELFILTNALAIPIFGHYPSDEIATQPWVHGFDINPYGDSAFQDVWFDDTAPERQIP